MGSLCRFWRHLLWPEEHSFYDAQAWGWNEEYKDAQQLSIFVDSDSRTSPLPAYLSREWNSANRDRLYFGSLERLVLKGVDCKKKLGLA